MIDYQQFTIDLTTATKLALAEVEAQRPGETVSVFGYETDDDLVVLTPLANTVEEHRRMVERNFYSDEEQVDSLTIQDWPLYGVGDTHFQEGSAIVNQFIHEGPQPGESESARKLNFLKACGRALQAARGDRDELFLGIFNPDPGLENLALYYCVAKLINRPGRMLDL